MVVVIQNVQHLKYRFIFGLDKPQIFLKLFFLKQAYRQLNRQ